MRMHTYPPEGVSFLHFQIGCCRHLDVKLIQCIYVTFIHFVTQKEAAGASTMWHCRYLHLILTSWIVAVGHSKDVIDLAAPSGSPGLLVSLSKDGNIRLWHASHEYCTASYTSEASSLVSRTNCIPFVTDCLYTKQC